MATPYILTLEYNPQTHNYNFTEPVKTLNQPILDFTNQIAVEQKIGNVTTSTPTTTPTTTTTTTTTDSRAGGQATPFATTPTTSTTTPTTTTTPPSNNGFTDGTVIYSQPVIVSGTTTTTPTPTTNTDTSSANLLMNYINNMTTYDYMMIAGGLLILYIILRKK